MVRLLKAIIIRPGIGWSLLRLVIVIAGVESFAVSIGVITQNPHWAGRLAGSLFIPAVVLWTIGEVARLMMKKR